MRKFSIHLMEVLKEVNRNNGGGNVWRGNGYEFFIFEERHKSSNISNMRILRWIKENQTWS